MLCHTIVQAAEGLLKWTIYLSPTLQKKKAEGTEKDK